MIHVVVMRSITRQGRCYCNRPNKLTLRKSHSGTVYPLNVAYTLEPHLLSVFIRTFLLEHPEQWFRSVDQNYFQIIQ